MSNIRKKLKISIIIVASNYILLAFLSFVSELKFDTDFIGKWGLLSGFLLLLGALPLYKMVYFGGRGIIGSQSPEIPPDEHLHQKLHNQYEKENKSKIKKDSKHQDVLTISGITIILISLFMI